MRLYFRSKKIREMHLITNTLRNFIYHNALSFMHALNKRYALISDVHLIMRQYGIERDEMLNYVRKQMPKTLAECKIGS